MTVLAVLSVLSYPGDTTVLVPTGQYPPSATPKPGSSGVVPGFAPASDAPRSLLWSALLFIPVGVFAYLTLPRWAWVLSLLVGPGISMMLQLAMWAAVPGRTADAAEWAATAAGSALGVGIAALVTWFVARPPRGQDTPPPRRRHRARTP